MLTKVLWRIKEMVINSTTKSVRTKWILSIEITWDNDCQSSLGSDVWWCYLLLLSYAHNWLNSTASLQHLFPGGPCLLDLPFLYKMKNVIRTLVVSNPSFVVEYLAGMHHKLFTIDETKTKLFIFLWSEQCLKKRSRNYFDIQILTT